LSLRLWHHRQEEDAWRAEIAYIRPIDRVPFKDADRVEQTMIRVFRDRGYELHNKYLTRLDRTSVDDRGAVVGVAAVAAVASYEHAYALVGAHGEAGWTGRLVPLTVDG
jgi:hypothetical protein